MNKRIIQKNHTRILILKTAGKLFRKNGFASTGIDSIMHKSGLTVGGFYAHFKSKKDLIKHCLSDIYQNSMSTLLMGTSENPQIKIKQIFKRYLSTYHRDSKDSCCPLVSIAAELERESKITSTITKEYLEKFIHEIVLLGLSRQEAIREISRNVGALLLSRILKGQSLSDEIINDNQN